MDMSSSSPVSANPNTSTTSMSTMEIAFFTSTTTPLYSTSWTPSNTRQYAGTCIFLIILATILRALFALRAIQERKWQQMEAGRRYIIAGPQEKNMEIKLSDNEGSKTTRNSDEGSLKVLRRKASAVRPWRTSQDVPRACLDVVIAGVGYLL